MIDAGVLGRVRAATCAIGYLTMSMEDYRADPLQAAFEVLGTGVAVRETTVMTNRHILEDIAAAVKQGIPENRFKVQFLYRNAQGTLVGGFGLMKARASIMNPEWDIGFIGIRPGGEARITPLAPIDPWQLSLTEEVAACGYPYGTAMLKRNTGKVYRWGPVIQRGYISAIAPYDTSHRPSELLLDLRIAGGMSGSPVFRPSDGGLLGIIYANWEATTALAVPVSRTELADWLRGYDAGGGDSV